MKFICLPILILVFFNSCDKKQNNSFKIGNSDSCDSEIKSIDVLYYNFLFDSAESVHWEDVKLNIPNFRDKYHAHGVLNAKITKCKVLGEIEERLKSLHYVEKKQTGADVRIVLTINYKKRKYEVLTIGGYFANNFFSANGNKLKSKNNNRLLFLIKNNIGYYPWINQENKEYMEELKDISAAKEPIIESSYYKQYLKLINTR